MQGTYALPGSTTIVPVIVVETARHFQELYARLTSPTGCAPAEVTDAEDARIQCLHDLRHGLEVVEFRKQRLSVAYFLVTVGREVEPTEPSKRVRNQARVVLAQKILEAGRVMWPRDAEDAEAIAILHVLVDFYAAHPEHNRGTSTRNEKAVWRFLETCWTNHRSVFAESDEVLKALIVTRGFEVLRRRQIIEATVHLYRAIRVWLQGVDACPTGHSSSPWYPSDGGRHPGPMCVRILDLCAHALRVEQPGFGIDNAGLHDAARTLLELLAYDVASPGTRRT